ARLVRSGLTRTANRLASVAARRSMRQQASPFTNRAPRARTNARPSGARSQTITFAAGPRPWLRTAIRKATVSPLRTTRSAATLVTTSTAGGAGFGGFGGTLTVTCAEAFALGFAPLGGVPVATATFVKLALTFPSVHV